MIVLDLFCGMGGWSIGFHREGFQCYGVDNVDVGYPYDLILSDIRKFSTENWHYKGGERVVDVVLASPPCTEFSTITALSYHKGQRGPPDPEKGLELVREAKRIIDDLNPRYWIVENMYGSREHIVPLLGPPKLQAKPWVLWGRFPQFMFEQEPRRHGKNFHAEKKPSGKWVVSKGGTKVGLPEDFAFDPLRSWKRARIPVFLSQTIARAIKVELEGVKLPDLETEVYTTAIDQPGKGR